MKLFNKGTELDKLLDLIDKCNSKAEKYTRLGKVEDVKMSIFQRDEFFQQFVLRASGSKTLGKNIQLVLNGTNTKLSDDDIKAFHILVKNTSSLITSLLSKNGDSYVPALKYFKKDLLPKIREIEKTMDVRSLASHVGYYAPDFYTEYERIMDIIIASKDAMACAEMCRNLQNSVEILRKELDGLEQNAPIESISFWNDLIEKYRSYAKQLSKIVLQSKDFYASAEICHNTLLDLDEVALHVKFMLNVYLQDKRELQKYGLSFGTYEYPFYNAIDRIERAFGKESLNIIVDKVKGNSLER